MFCKDDIGTCAPLVSFFIESWELEHEHSERQAQIIAELRGIIRQQTRIIEQQRRALDAARARDRKATLYFGKAMNDDR